MRVSDGSNVPTSVFGVKLKSSSRQEPPKKKLPILSERDPSSGAGVGVGAGAEVRVGAGARVRTGAGLGQDWVRAGVGAAGGA